MIDLPRPAATRLPRPRWLDPRLLIGVLLVLVSVAAGAKVVAEADDSYAVWAVQRDVGPRAALTEADLTTRKVRLDGDAGAYVAANGPAPWGWTLTRPVGAGELLPRAALAPPGSVATRRVALGVDPVVAADLAPGSVVDVYVVPAADRATRSPAPVQRVLAGVTVASVERGGGRGLGSSSGASVVLVLRGDQPGGRQASAQAAEQPGAQGAVQDEVTAFLEAQARGDIRLVAVPSGAPS